MRPMSRPLAPFIRHLGEAKHRTRQLRLAAERVHDAAIAVAGLTGDAAGLQREIAAVREQLALLEALAGRWEQEREEPGRASRSARTREAIAECLDPSRRAR